MQYYHDLVTQKSWEELKKLQKTVKFVLIGGWATYLYTKTLKSKDIDILIDFDQLPVLEKQYALFKNNRLQKYEAVKEEVQIDIYLPHYSDIGIPIEDLIQKKREVEGFTLLESNYLLVLKLFTLTRRGRTPKGRKDFIDILALIQSQIIDWFEVKSIIRRYHLREVLQVFKEFLNENYQLPELDLNQHHFSKMKKEIFSKIGFHL